jgi:hypothetical protein
MLCTIEYANMRDGVFVELLQVYAPPGMGMPNLIMASAGCTLRPEAQSQSLTLLVDPQPLFLKVAARSYLKLQSLQSSI